ncbi:MAG TPA: S1 RNA-binding domain-containing protein [Ktedonobacteraceae bacterium]|nr:S1 RNA-binding domain-containing protein [Ktedonobacteraceae bacterium]
MDDQQPVNPWADAEVRYQVGQEVRASVTRVAQFGVFVQVEPGMEGIVYAFELGQGPSVLAGFAPGQEMHLYVKNVDAGKKRLELSPRNQVQPGLATESDLPPFARQKGRVGTLSWPESPFLPQAPADQGRQYCPGCQREVQTAWKYCVYCGESLQRRCPACGSAQPDLPEARYCCECGRMLS